MAKGAAVLMVGTLPLNANGKVDKRALRDRYVRATTAEDFVVARPT
jgi:acyl-CoA synthetase (AMP-forming)/AMP-acid ligase II